jgi:Glutaminase
MDSQEEYHQLFNTKPLIPYLQVVEYEQRQYIFDLIVAENIEYRYLNGSWEDRTHLICLLLKKAGIDAGKIWNFAPARYTLLSNELFHIQDPLGISNPLYWGFHVSPYILSYNQAGELETLIFDLSFDTQNFLSIADWQAIMNCPRALYLQTHLENYLFYSIESYSLRSAKIGNNPVYNIPAAQPSIITGDFWKLTPEDTLVQNGLAINDLAIYIFLAKDRMNTSEIIYLSETLTNIDWLDGFVFCPRPLEVSEKLHNELIQFHKARFDFWDKKLQTLI